MRFERSMACPWCFVGVRIAHGGDLDSGYSSYLRVVWMVSCEWVLVKVWFPDNDCWRPQPVSSNRATSRLLEEDFLVMPTMPNATEKKKKKGGKLLRVISKELPNKMSPKRLYS